MSEYLIPATKILTLYNYVINLIKEQNIQMLQIELEIKHR